ncbi:MAG: PSD1 domain-containing protein [Lunatimonas sp.]|uniref:PSD1 and planctomycete cytochrome C domain-containing protein n=1 Tax=Lunatimonas sp. TaxID=2060141 RepID=UPI00263B2F02|nr:PSD1 and planctomycete cytochrome C domain-containing protein [Lunatimonas sp.]MCC5936580.1 PSD1 domain-containing protein [Lunatimonas sp.]
MFFPKSVYLIFQRLAIGCFLLALGVGCGESTPISSSDLPEVVDFNFHIKPILVQKCYLCHGPDPSSREADLRLDIFEGATGKLENGKRAIVPGKPGKSYLLERITHHDSELRMPPPATNQEVTPEEVALIEKWIKQGAEYKPHWAFVAPDPTNFQRFEGMAIADAIDTLVREKQREKGLTASATADKQALIRRLSYVLTGLPPTMEELAAFLSDDSPQAYAKLVDGYLASPAYGERWARHWMDVVRYAETRGHEFDYAIQGAWRYRDYLIRAFNADVPYDAFVKEQLAGDLLESPRVHPETRTNESVLGTLFFTLGEGTHSPVDTRKDESDRIDNMIDVTTKAFQALTVACAKCHDHKFDPIPTADYYALYGIMEGTRFSPQPAHQLETRKVTLQEAQKLQAHIRKQFASSWQPIQGESSPFQLTSFDDWNTTPAADVKVLGDFRGQDFGGWKSDGMAFGPKTTLGNPVLTADGKSLERLEEGMASSRYFGTGKFGVLRSPDFTIDSQFLGVKARGSLGTIRVVMDNFQLIQYPIYGGMSQSVGSEEWKELVFDVGQWKGHKAYLEILPGRFQSHNYIQGEQDYVEVQYAISFDNSWQEPSLTPSRPSGSVGSMIKDWVEFKSGAEEVQALNRWVSQAKGAKSLEGLDNLNRQWLDLTGSVKDTVYFSGVTEGFKTESPVFIRGSHTELSPEKVPRRFLPDITSSKPAFMEVGSGRVEMVEALLSRENPLTARVMVNRIWHHLFGRGIVETVDNFGLQGKLPSHPELLDYLALSFVEQGWSVKELIRAMVMTETFQRSYQPVESSKTQDPENLYLSSYPVRRLEAEAIRDGMLRVAGNLRLEPFGKPVPVHLTSFMQGRGRPGNSGPLDGDGRRSVYVEVRRNFVSHLLQTFDFPTPFTSFGKRDVTNVPAQSLLLMNDPFVVRQAEVWASKTLAGSDRSIAERVERLYREAFSRLPQPNEIETAKSLLYAWGQREGLVQEEDILTHPEVWVSFCHSLLNLKEFIYLM